MVKDSRAAARADQLRPLNRPRPVTVLVDAAKRPVALIEGERRARVARVQDRWCIDDEWWRDPIQRVYYRVVLETGALRTIYHDRAQDAWFEQSY
jgi:hypothetical protein